MYVCMCACVYACMCVCVCSLTAPNMTSSVTSKIGSSLTTFRLSNRGYLANALALLNTPLPLLLEADIPMLRTITGLLGPMVSLSLEETESSSSLLLPSELLVYSLLSLSDSGSGEGGRLGGGIILFGASRVLLISLSCSSISSIVGELDSGGVVVLPLSRASCLMKRGSLGEDDIASLRALIKSVGDLAASNICAACLSERVLLFVPPFDFTRLLTTFEMGDTRRTMALLLSLLLLLFVLLLAISLFWKLGDGLGAKREIFLPAVRVYVGEVGDAGEVGEEGEREESVVSDRESSSRLTSSNALSSLRGDGSLLVVGGPLVRGGIGRGMGVG